MNILLKKQKGLCLNLKKYSLEKVWNSHELINKLRKKVIKLMPTGFFDPQDLEHQVLFRLTTFHPDKIDDDLIRCIIDEQLLIIEERLSKINKFDLDYLFRGLKNLYKDLNCKNRLSLIRNNSKIYARNTHYQLEVEFKKIKDKNIIDLFTSKLHYIHQGRVKGEAFGFYFKGDNLPWAVETTEPAIVAKQYKQNALLAHGIDPNHAIELTRFYTLPGCPKNCISMINSKLRKYYQPKGIEAIFTAIMPMYAKTKSATISGGMDKVLLIKELKHKFIKVKINNHICYKQVTNSFIKKNKIKDYITTCPAFPTMHTVETYMIINQPNLKPLPALKNKTIYVKFRNKKIEKEVKVKVNNLNIILPRVRKIAQFKDKFYIKDIIFGNDKDKNKNKIRLRIQDGFDWRKIIAERKYLTDYENNIRTYCEETLYEGNSYSQALKKIKKLKFKKENSYEKIRIIYQTKNKTEIMIDIYPFGAYLEIEGKKENIKKILKQLKIIDKKQIVNKNADECYLSWSKEKGLKEMWDIRFGLTC